MKLTDLKQKRAQKVDELKKITQTAEDEKRFKTDEERAKWDELKKDVEELDKLIKDVEYEESVDKAEVVEDAERAKTPEGEKEAEQRGFNVITDKSKKPKYSITRALNAHLNNKPLDGYEGDMHNQGAERMQRFGHTPNGLVIPDSIMRAAVTAAGNPEHLEKIVKMDFSAQEKGVLDQLGVTTYNDATAQIGLIHTKGVTAGIYAELEEVEETNFDQVADVLAPRRIHAYKPFTRSYLAQTATLPDFIRSMEYALDSAETRDIVDKILAIAGADATGASTSGDGSTYAGVLAMQANLEVENVQRPFFMTGNSLYFGLKAVQKGIDNGAYLVTNDMIDGVRFVNAGSKVGAGTLIFGDAAGLFRARFGADVEILLDPYSKAKTGQIDVHVIRMGDTAVNPWAVSFITGLTV